VGFQNPGEGGRGDDRMQVAAASMYVRHLGLDKVKPKLEAMVEYIKGAYLEAIDEKMGNNSAKEHHHKKVLVIASKQIFSCVINKSSCVTLYCIFS
jgi:hypothetical protein